MRPPQEQYDLPSEVPFTAQIVSVAHCVTEVDIQQAFSSLTVKEIRSPGNMRSVFFVEFHDLQGLKKCLDEYWLFKIKGSPIRTYVASAHRSTPHSPNDGAFSSKPNTDLKPPELLSLTCSFESPSGNIRLQQSLLVLIYAHLLRLLCKSSLDWDHYHPRRPFLSLKNDIPSFSRKLVT
ncbi:hypothetical protein GEMRC1_001152 [Eukaryota sp. GEM-RC1]